MIKLKKIIIGIVLLSLTVLVGCTQGYMKPDCTTTTFCYGDSIDNYVSKDICNEQLTVRTRGACIHGCFEAYRNLTGDDDVICYKLCDQHEWEGLIWKK